jgi:hypothetical protein
MTGECQNVQLFSDEMGSHNLFCPGCSGTTILLILASHVAWDGRHEILHVLLFEMGASWIVCPAWPQSRILPISVSQVARITGLSHWCLACSLLLNMIEFLQNHRKKNHTFMKLVLLSRRVCVVLSHPARDSTYPWGNSILYCSPNCWLGLGSFTPHFLRTWKHKFKYDQAWEFLQIESFSHSNFLKPTSREPRALTDLTL